MFTWSATASYNDGHNYYFKKGQNYLNGLGHAERLLLQTVEARYQTCSRQYITTCTFVVDENASTKLTRIKSP